jgi:hypothetical protein
MMTPSKAVLGLLALALLVPRPALAAGAPAPLPPPAQRLQEALARLGLDAASRGLDADALAGRVHDLLAAPGLDLSPDMAQAVRSLGPDTLVAEIRSRTTPDAWQAPATVVVGPLVLTPKMLGSILGSRLGRDRHDVVLRLRGMVPTQASPLSDAEILALVPGIAAAEQARQPIPADLSAAFLAAVAPKVAVQ